MKSTKQIIFGGLLALAFAGLIIYSLETEKSILQILLGFVLFFLPITFISVFKSRTGSFIFVFFSVLIIYIATKFSFNDFWIGALMATLLGGSVFITKINPYSPFNASKYKDSFKNKSEQSNNDPKT